MQKILAIKLIVIGVIGLMLMVPINMISNKIWERNNYLLEAKEAVAASWTGSQIIMGPLIVIPYEVEVGVTSWDKSGNKIVTVHKEIQQMWGSS